MTVLLIADHDNEHLSEQTTRALTAALLIENSVDILVAGNNAEVVANAAAMLRGVRKVLLAESADLGNFLVEPLADLVVTLARDYEAIVAPATASGKNVAPRIAAILDIAQVSEIVEVVSPDTFKHPIYAGNAVRTVQSLDRMKVVTVRTTAFEPTGEGGSATVHRLALSKYQNLSRFVENRLSETTGPQLTSAKIVISGGRALGSAARFQSVLVPLADKLGAAVGASRAAVDAGYASNDLQVGQTGKVVAPDLYIACGISGAVQHLAGMKDSKVIVAINNDGDAPIFQIADYGIVGDLFTILPEIEQAL